MVLLPNRVAALVVAVVSPAFVPITLHQSALVAMAVYDLGAVLIPGGPLRVLLELAMERNEEIPALIYEARPVDPRHGQNWRLWGQPAGDLDPTSTAEVIGEVLERRRNSADSLTRAGGVVGNPTLREFLVPDLSSESANAQAREVLALPETRVDVAALRVPLIQPLPDRTREYDDGDDDDDEADGIGLGSSGAIKLGLGDFIFYSVLVGGAAMYDYMTQYTLLPCHHCRARYYSAAVGILPQGIACTTGVHYPRCFVLRAHKNIA